MHVTGAGRIALASGLIGLGILSLVYGDFALQWQPVPAWVPGRDVLARVSGSVMVACGAGLLWKRAAASSSRVLFLYFVSWWLLLELPKVIKGPTVEANWLGLGEIAVLVAAGWILYATLHSQADGLMASCIAGEKGVRRARIPFGIALIPIGLSHFFYAPQTLSFVPVWLPARIALVYLTGTAHIAAGIGMLFSILPRVAASLEAAMIVIFTLLVWVPRVVAAPTNQLQWTATLISWTIAAGAWVVADSYGVTPAHEQLSRDLGSRDPSLELAR